MVDHLVIVVRPPSSWRLALFLCLASCYNPEKMVAVAWEVVSQSNRTDGAAASRMLMPEERGKPWAPQYHDVYSSNPDPSCLDDPDQVKCCPVEDRSPCLITIIRPSDGCTPACKRRYATFGYECYREYRNHFQWMQAARNCDPENRIVFRPPPVEEQPPPSSTSPSLPAQQLPDAPERAAGEQERQEGQNAGAKNGTGGQLPSPIETGQQLLASRRFWDVMIATGGPTAVVTMLAAGGATFVFGFLGIPKDADLLRSPKAAAAAAARRSQRPLDSQQHPTSDSAGSSLSVPDQGPGAKATIHDL